MDWDEPSINVVEQDDPSIVAAGAVAILHQLRETAAAAQAELDFHPWSRVPSMPTTPSSAIR